MHSDSMRDRAGNSTEDSVQRVHRSEVEGVPAATYRLDRGPRIGSRPGQAGPTSLWNLFRTCLQWVSHRIDQQMPTTGKHTFKWPVRYSVKVERVSQKGLTPTRNVDLYIFLTDYLDHTTVFGS